MLAKANEKGHVERSVEYVRRRAFSKHDHFDSLEAANQYLLAECAQLNELAQRLKQAASGKELLEKERPALYPTVPCYQCFKVAHG